MFGFFKRRRRRRLRAESLKPEWQALALERVPHARLLTEAERAQLFADTNILLHEKYWEGCGGFELTDAVRVTVAAQAALLLLNRETDYYPKLTSILVYPARYVVEATRQVGGGIVSEGPEVRAGEAWYRGAVVLSWDDTARGAIHPHDGHNVVLHEFAHQLDAESGDMNGAPRLRDRALEAAWHRVMTREFERLQAQVTRGQRSVLRPYGATKPAEFFAVATEVFFERPLDLERQLPEVYDLLRRFYHQDPGRRVQRGSRIEDRGSR
jgi:Mlc titration factor MtfA (ptsG expression regulator)